MNDWDVFMHNIFVPATGLRCFLPGLHSKMVGYLLPVISSIFFILSSASENSRFPVRAFTPQKITYNFDH